MVPFAAPSRSVPSSAFFFACQVFEARVGLVQVPGPVCLVVRAKILLGLVVRDLVEAWQHGLAAREPAPLVIEDALRVVVDRGAGALAHTLAADRRVGDPPDLGVWSLVEPSDLRHQSFSFSYV